MEGDFTLGGSAEVILGNIQIGTGEISINGSAGYSPNYNYLSNTPPPHKIAISGLATIRANLNFIMSGGLKIGGQSSIGKGNRYSMSGGITTGGSATTQPNMKFTSRGGGLSMSGLSSFKLNLRYVSSGNIHISGAIAPPTVSLSWTMSGGSIVSGTSKAFWGQTHTMSGGISTGGTSGQGGGLKASYSYKPNFPHNRIFVYGKASCGRSSYSYTMTGGLTIRGGYKSDFCTNSCNTSFPFFRNTEAQVGCPVVQPDGKIDYVCARTMELLSDVSVYPNRSWAIVPAITVCRQNLFIKGPKDRNCSSIIRH